MPAIAAKMLALWRKGRAQPDIARATGFTLRQVKCLLYKALAAETGVKP